jgi:hypothetical protein
MESAADAELLHVLLVKGVVSRDALTQSAGEAAIDALAGLIDRGLVVAVGPEQRRMYSLAGDGRERAAGAVREAMPAARSALERHYDEIFLPLNARFKHLCLRWQDDPEDVALLDETDGVHDEIEALLREPADVLALPRLRRYADRLDRLKEAVDGGDLDAYLAPTGESYHNVWFELHEDLLLSLGRSRDQEASQQRQAGTTG